MFYFKENTELENLDNVPTEYQVFYVKGQDNKFRINDTMKATTDNIDGLRTNMTTAQNNLTRANTESSQRRVQLEAIAALGVGTTPEEIKAKFDQMTKDLTDGKKINPDTIRQEITAQFEGKLTEANGKVTAAEAELTDILIGDHVTRSIVENKGNLALLTPIVRSKVGIVLDPVTGKRIAVGVNDKGEALPGTDGGFMPVSKVVEAIKKDTQFAAAFEGTQQSGGGSRPVGGPTRQVITPPAGRGAQTPTGRDGQKSSMQKINSGLATRAQGG